MSTTVLTDTDHTIDAKLGLAEEHDRAYRARYLMGITRIALGFVFLWAFLDKTFGLGFATASEDAWINGGSPTFGYLNFATEGKAFHDFFAGLAGTAADWLFMLGLLGIGLALILGIGTRIAAVLLSIVMIGALIYVKQDLGIISSGPMPGAELDLALLAGLIALIVIGPGRLSIDEQIGLEPTSTTDPREPALSGR